MVYPQDTTIIYPHLTMDGIYKLVGVLIVGWCLNSIWDWFKHVFWIGFKAGIVAQVKKGSALTPEENAALKTKVRAQVQEEWNNKIKKLANIMADSPEEPHGGPTD
jgi:hypothetical protein